MAEGKVIALPEVAARHIQASQAAARQGDSRSHLRELQAAVRAAPEHPAVLNMLAVRLIADGDHRQSSALLERATRADPLAPELFLNLAKARRVGNDAAGERVAIDAALALDQRHFAARVRRAEWHERANDPATAASDWSAVLQLSAALSPDQSREIAALLDHARSVVADWTRKVASTLDEGLARTRAGIPVIERRRFEAGVDAAMGRRRVYHPEPLGLHFPFLPAEEFFPRALLPFLSHMEQRTDAIRVEALELLDSGGEAFVPYVANPPGAPPDKWSELDHSTRWSALFLHKHGQPDQAALDRFPATAAALKDIALNDIPSRGPTVFFSLLKAGARIPPHTGVTNTRTIVHLPLIVPPDCGFRVGGETREWVEGEAFGFDDTIEHEAWNESDRPRVVLIFDVWNPYLTESERELLRTYYRVADANGLNPELRET